MTAVNVRWITESDRSKALTHCDCLLILTSPTLLARQLLYFCTPVRKYIERVFVDEGFCGDQGQCVLLQGLAALKPDKGEDNEISGQITEVKRILFYGLDSQLCVTTSASADAYPAYALQQQFDALFTRLTHVSTNCKSLSLLQLFTTETDEYDPVQCMAEHPSYLSVFIHSYVKHSYHFSGYKTTTRPVQHGADDTGSLTLVLHKGSVSSTQRHHIAQSVRYEIALNNAMNWAKDLAHMPANLCTPDYLTEQALQLANTFTTISCTMLNQITLQELGMNGYLAVNAGSQFDATMPILHYQCRNDAAPLVLIGKGVTFDGGGITLKRSPDMRHMTYDMAGAGCVLGVIQAVATLGLEINLIGILATADNAIDGGAYRPGDIITMHAGKTVEIMSTDAEGRMLMADAISYAKRFSPAAIIDIATLTGAAISALGHNASMLFSNSRALEKALTEAGEQANDRCWPFPLWPEYQDAISSPHADMMNTGINSPGAISAACFLSRFADDIPWAHLDVAGTAFTFTRSLSATGRPIPLLLSYLSRYASQKNP